MPELSPERWTKGQPGTSAHREQRRNRMTIVWILIVIILVLLAIYLFRRVV